MRISQSLANMMKGIVVDAFGDATPTVMRLAENLPIPQPTETQVSSSI